MAKGFFLSLPSISVNKTLAPVIKQFSLMGHEMVYYNLREFPRFEQEHYRFKAYPNYRNGYRAGGVHEHTSYFQFAHLLMDTAAELIDFLLEEIAREKPDFILHSHLAPWGKLAAERCKLPAVNFSTTFFLHEDIMLPLLKKLKGVPDASGSGAGETISLYRKLNAVYRALHIDRKPDIWDVNFNREELNISFISEDFQPCKERLGPEYQFAGFPMRPGSDEAPRDIIYLSLGTVFNKDIGLYRLAIECLKELNCNSVISVGSAVSPQELGELPPNITVIEYADQVRMLQRSILFITRGGMASVQESMHTETPMVALPEIPEQQLTADKIVELGIGVQIGAGEVTAEALTGAIREVMGNRAYYHANLRQLVHRMPGEKASLRACALVESYLKTKMAM